MSGKCPSPPWHCPLQVAESVSKAEHAPLFKLLEAQPAQRLPEAPGSRTGTRPRTPSNAAEHLHRAVLWGSLWICDSRHIERPPRHKKNISFSALAFWTQDLKGTTQPAASLAGFFGQPGWSRVSRNSVQAFAGQSGRSGAHPDPLLTQLSLSQLCWACSSLGSADV